MSGVKANIADVRHPAGAVGKPAANAGQGEPSIDDILASIRQIISDQNRQADFAAEKAAADVANKAPAAAKVESIIGAIAADHWTGRADISAPSRAPEFVPLITGTSKNPSELEELIQLIGATPPAPSPTKQAMWIDPNSKNTQKAKTAIGSSANFAAPLAKNNASTEPRPVSVRPANVEMPANNATSGPGASKPSVILPGNASSLGQNSGQASRLPAEVRQEIMPEPRLHPSVSPKTVVPQVIKQAIARPLAKTVAANSQPHSPRAHTSQAHTPQALPVQGPEASSRSALDRLIARKAGRESELAPVVEAPVQQIVVPKSAAPTPAPPQNSQQAAPAQKAVGNSPAISSQAVNAAVVKSIERLATSMFSDRKEEIDGMMAGIVRPMLQDWLEDNLPSLVERIVREEIERVSRGTHQ